MCIRDRNIKIPQFCKIQQASHHIRPVPVAQSIGMDEIGPPQLERSSIDPKIHISSHGNSAESYHLFQKIRCSAAAGKLLSLIHI